MSAVLRIIDPVADTMNLTLRTAGGDDDAGQDLQILGWMLGRIKTAPRRKRLACHTCPTILRRENVVIAAAVVRDDASRAVGFAWCRDCAATYQDAVRLGIAAVRKAWPSVAVELREQRV